MTAAPVPNVELGSMLYVFPSPAGGRLCVTGTGISVRQIFCMFNNGDSPEAIAADYAPHLPLAGVYAAIAYYLANKTNLDAELEADDAESRRLQKSYEKHGHFPEFAQK
jgi:uncharacterized protein (DUF433 family)